MARAAQVWAPVTAIGVLLAVRATLQGHALQRQPPSTSSGAAFAISGARSTTPSALRVPMQQVKLSQVPNFSEPAAPGWASNNSTIGLLGLCAAIAARALTSNITCFAKTGNGSRSQRKPSRKTDWKDKQLGYRINGSPGWASSPHAWTEDIRWCHRFKRRVHIRRKVEGTPARPRMAVFRSLSHMVVNIVDDTIGLGKTLLTVTTKQKDCIEVLREEKGTPDKFHKDRTWTLSAAEVVGAEVAKKCLEQNITSVVFDRGGFTYSGRLKALAEAARSGGLQF